MDVDLISFDPDDIGLVKCNRKMYNLAAERGLSFEIMYTPAIRDSTARKNIIQLAHFYHAFGKSKVRLWVFVLSSFIKLSNLYVHSESGTYFRIEKWHYYIV
jgi:RNase P/RNase MRP subunit p30